jgi:hypothetical protein
MQALASGLPCDLRGHASARQGEYPGWVWDTWPPSRALEWTPDGC